MYFEKLTREDFKQFLSKNIIVNRFGEKIKDATITIVLKTEYRIILNVNIKKNGYKICLDSISLGDFGEYPNDYSLMSIKFNTNKFYRFMIKKFGEKYLDDLLKFKGVPPELVKEVYSLSTDWEDK